MADEAEHTDPFAALRTVLGDVEFALERMRARGAEASCSDAALEALRRGLTDFLTIESAAPLETIAPVAPSETTEHVGEVAPVPKSSSDLPKPERSAARMLVEIREDLGDCTRCKLHAERKNIVFGVGNPDAELMFVGEGPGADEDEQGEPFVGRAGQLLTKMIQAMGKQRSDIYIANVVKCRPPGNRAPTPDEVAACGPFLRRQIEAIGPKIICTLGNAATSALLGKNEGITKLRGTFHPFEGGVLVMPTYHPAYLLRSPDHKKDAWNDLQQVMTELGWPIPKRGAP
ncbi:MAG: uracil-DNA glycosylase [Deltaproteobacteria bacterium]|nr:uracil-DNA glycosylase [Deltaproteobacteria bacterium]